MEENVDEFYIRHSTLIREGILQMIDNVKIKHDLNYT